MKFDIGGGQGLRSNVGISYQIPEPLPRGLHPGVMPLDFGSVREEVAACQLATALFDYSFLLRLIVCGPDAILGVSEICGRDFSDLGIGAIRYALMSDPDGWLVSDLTVWRSAKDKLEILSGRAEDIPYIKKALASYNLKTLDVSDQTAVLALQGPKTNRIFSSNLELINVANIPYFGFRDLELCGVACRVGRLGYTGLDGVEILCTAKDAKQLWKLLSLHARPAGFCAANFLRLKAGLPLFAHEFKPPVSAADIGLKRVRPHGKLFADQKPPRVSRVCFSFHILIEHGGEEQDILDILWTPEEEFPPEPGTLAVTSISRDLAPDRQIGMGYVVPNEKGKNLARSSEFIKDIRITREFINFY